MKFRNICKEKVGYMLYTYNMYIYIYMGSGRFPGPMELLLQQLVRVSKTR